MTENSSDLSAQGAGSNQKQAGKKESLELRDVRTPEMLMDYLKQNKVKDLSNTLIHTVLLNQKPKHHIYLVQSVGVNLNLLQRILVALDSEDRGRGLNFKTIEITNGKRFVLARNHTKEKDQLEKLQAETGGSVSDTINDVGTIRIIYLEPGYNEHPEASDCSLYEILKES